eukprot:CAMPEP_0116837076 /NCGR_PEP_ID=MMETSP0418-20121206/8454_1 /TAXON_ID=1158023 /ORGANISM="Astrosyne radiata, Strain 13vi08-1A" /LENGTH=37 /DNA_ID= /DNA_START= /DNA_END= /DNA_ORIENTATION=
MTIVVAKNKILPTMNIFAIQFGCPRVEVIVAVALHGM